MKIDIINTTIILEAKTNEKVLVLDPVTNNYVECYFKENTTFVKEGIYLTTSDSRLDLYNKNPGAQYCDYIKHVRHGNIAVMSREEMVRVISSGQYEIW